MFCDEFKEKLPDLRNIEGGLKTTDDDEKIAYQSKYGCIEIQRYPFRKLDLDKINAQSAYKVEEGDV